MKNNNMPLVSVLILNYNGEYVLQNCILSILNNNYSNFEIIFVDNGSTDRSLQNIMEKFRTHKKLKIIENGNNFGWPKGINIGIRHCNGKYVSILEPDTEVDPNWLVELVKLMEMDSNVGAAQSKMLFKDDPRKFDSIGGVIDYFGIESQTTANAVGEQNVGQFDFVREIFYARGAAMILKKDVFYEAGMLDEYYFLGGYDDIDICWRIRLSGYKILFIPKSIVYHIGGRLIARIKWPFAFFHLRKNHIATLIKNYELKNLVRYLPPYILLVILHAFYEACKLELKVSHACLNSIFWNIKNLRMLYSRRKIVQSTIRKIPDKEIMKFMSKPVMPWYIISSKLKNKIPGKVYYSEIREHK